MKRNLCRKRREKKTIFVSAVKKNRSLERCEKKTVSVNAMKKNPFRETP